ncbi:MAG: HPr family phosphocarrier protein [Clostridia bacterium]|nr:HPr family phosphocarrier protein [Clostridia bacterium]
MCEVHIVLKGIEDVRSFVKEVILMDHEVDLVQGRYVVDAKSVMGIFSLDLLSPIAVQVHADNADAFFAKIKKYIVD